MSVSKQILLFLEIRKNLNIEFSRDAIKNKVKTAEYADNSASNKYVSNQGTQENIKTLNLWQWLETCQHNNFPMRTWQSSCYYQL